MVDNEKYGYIDHDGKVVIKPQFVWGSKFKDGWANVYLCGRVVSIDAKGNIFPHSPADENKLRSKKVNGKYGFVDSSGIMIIPPVYDQVLWFTEGLAPVRIGMKWGFIDEKGVTVIPFKFTSARVFHDGVVIVWVGGTLQINTPGINEISGGSEGIIDKKGKVLAKGFITINESSQGRMLVGKDDLFGYMDTLGNINVAITYEFAKQFSEGLAAVKKDGKWGYIDQSGEVIIPFIYEDTVNLSEGLAAVKKQGKWGYIDKSGAVVIPFQFDSADNFSSGITVVEINNEFGAIDRTGKLLFNNPEIEIYDHFRNAKDIITFWTREGESFGYINSSGKIVWGPVQWYPDPKPFTWSECQQIESCAGVPEGIKQMIASFPPE